MALRAVIGFRRGAPSLSLVVPDKIETSNIEELKSQISSLLGKKTNDRVILHGMTNRGEIFCIEGCDCNGRVPNNVCATQESPTNGWNHKKTYVTCRPKAIYKTGLCDKNNKRQYPHNVGDMIRIQLINDIETETIIKHVRVPDSGECALRGGRKSSFPIILFEFYLKIIIQPVTGIDTEHVRAFIFIRDPRSIGRRLDKQKDCVPKTAPHRCGHESDRELDVTVFRVWGGDLRGSVTEAIEWLRLNRIAEHAVFYTSEPP